MPTARDIPIQCLFSAGLAGALAQASAFAAVVFWLNANLLWGGRHEGTVLILGIGFGFVAVASPIALLRLKYILPIPHGLFIAVVCLWGAPMLLAGGFAIFGLLMDGPTGLYAGLYWGLSSAFMFVPGVPGAALGVWAGTRAFRQRGPSEA